MPRVGRGAGLLRRFLLAGLEPTSLAGRARKPRAQGRPRSEKKRVVSLGGLLMQSHPKKGILQKRSLTDLHVAWVVQARCSILAALPLVVVVCCHTPF